MHVVVVYGTIEGQTRKIAHRMAGTVQSAGHDVSVFDAADTADVDIAAADALIVAAPVHTGKYPAALSHWLKTNAAAINQVPSAFVSVSLAVASFFAIEHREIETLTSNFLDEVGWKPNEVHQAAGALRYLEHNFFKRLLMRHIAKREGAPVHTSKNYEFTNWDELAQFIFGFLQKTAD